MDRAKHYKDNYFGNAGIEKDFYDKGLLRPDEVCAIAYAFGMTASRRALWRTPQNVLSIGCGQGRVEEFLAQKGVKVLGVDIADNTLPNKSFEFKEGGMYDIEYKDFDTVIFCEAIEHIPVKEFDDNWLLIVDMLKKNRGLFIVTNWFEYHPIRPDASGWNHVREVNENFYDYLGSLGEVVVRDRSHLVIQF